jgi:hypothetical protein
MSEVQCPASLRCAWVSMISTESEFCAALADHELPVIVQLMLNILFEKR